MNRIRRKARIAPAIFVGIVLLGFAAAVVWALTFLYKEGGGSHRFVVSEAVVRSEVLRHLSTDKNITNPNLYFDSGKVYITADVEEGKVKGKITVGGTPAHGAIRGHFYLSDSRLDTESLVSRGISGKEIDRTVRKLSEALKGGFEKLTIGTVGPDPAETKWRWYNEVTIDGSKMTVEYSFGRSTTNAFIALCIVIALIIYLTLWVVATEFMWMLHFFWMMGS